MRLQVVSDLHLDHSPLPEGLRLADGVDAVICAGDNCEGGARSVGWLRRIFGDEVPIVMTLGNHEYYGSSVPETLAVARRAAREHGVHLLEDSTVEVGGQVFAGATLWTDFALYGHRSAAMETARQQMNDYRCIRGAVPGHGMLRPQETLELHRASVDWLEQHVPPRAVVVTHCLPHGRSVNAQYERDPLNAAFASDLSHVMRSVRPRLWVHGHTHSSSDYHAPETGVRVVCNPRGYGRENPRFDPVLVVEI